MIIGRVLLLYVIWFVQGFTLDWCKNSDRGLPDPDLVMYLDLAPEAAARRGAYGEERYERTDFQQRVYDNYQALKTEEWKVGAVEGQT